MTELIYGFIGARKKWISEISFCRYKILSYPHHEKMLYSQYRYMWRRALRDHINFMGLVFLD